MEKRLSERGRSGRLSVLGKWQEKSRLSSGFRVMNGQTSRVRVRSGVGWVVREFGLYPASQSFSKCDPQLPPLQQNCLGCFFKMQFLGLCLRLEARSCRGLRPRSVRSYNTVRGDDHEYSSDGCRLRASQPGWGELR